MTDATPRPIRTLLFSTLYPSAARPIHGVFVETRLRELLQTGQVETKVVAPVPWFPFKGKRFGVYGKYAETPKIEHRNSIDIFHPRYLLPPKVGMNIAPYSLARSALPTIRKIIRDGFDFDLIDAHYYYPDGVAAGIIAHALGKPFVVTARGSDLNLIAQYPKPRRLILQTAKQAKASIGVSSGLMQVLSSLGAEASKLRVMRNGVDLERFQPIEQTKARDRLGLPNNCRILLSVGNLIELKGHNIAIKALAKLNNNERLVLVGHGPERSALQELADKHQLSERVLFAGQVPNEELACWYSAADALLLCSSREGWANVLLESMACGTPVIATNIPGTNEVIRSNAVGRLMSRRDDEALLAAYADLFSKPIDKIAIREYAKQFGWDVTTQAQIELFQEVSRSQ
ncbi:glycosyltransferase family 4 protein [Dechloromonas denitrificans]|uniref:glycosyltransferase family 4 protein n=1 Tax=Dechloromonas denitrificans TaxID=281362 RepID=UPI001F0AB40C|nr:glycosyltransferase family 4 protein [Dechloromonas denitrificans]